MIRRRAGALSVALSMCLLVSSCAQAAKPAIVHIDMANGESEHDEAVYPNGNIIDAYPNRVRPHEVIFHKPNGGMIDAFCLNTACSNVRLQITGSKVMADGTYQLLQTDDPKIMMVRDGEGTRTLGYFAKNGGGSQFFPDLQQAQAYEHQGETAKAVGKVVGGTLLVAALVVLAGAAAAADARANAVTTRCSSVGNSTTCTTY
ncbi:hypothetical protein [Candidatus Binatus sp.]|uniref:hypothetical protein n=1 Tax=Candidatus Binatus sp. TaxID=2811406 RepID=UPI002F94465A